MERILITLSDKAAEKIKEYIVQNNMPEGSGMRFGVKGGGCGGFQYFFMPTPKSGPEDEIFEHNGAKLFIDARSLIYLDGSEIDWGPVEHLMGEGFIIINPNSGGSCGCGQSFTPGDF